MKEAMLLEELYFAYGSNLNLGPDGCPLPAGRGGRQGCAGRIRTGLPARVLTILPKEGSRVNGLLWRVNAWDELTLDRYEGYPYLYTKELLPVQTDSGPQNVVAYVMATPYCERVQPPTSTYLQTVLAGYRLAGFEPKAVLQAAARARDVQAQSHKQHHPDAER